MSGRGERIVLMALAAGLSLATAVTLAFSAPAKAEVVLVGVLPLIR